MKPVHNTIQNEYVDWDIDIFNIIYYNTKDIFYDTVRTVTRSIVWGSPIIFYNLEFN